MTKIDPRGRLQQRNRVLWLCRACCLGLLFLVLAVWADPAVREEPPWFFALVLGGVAVLIGIEWLMPFFGVSPREDGVVSGNDGALASACGAFLGAMFCYAGSNIGRGETEWTTIFPALLSLSGFLFCWLVHELLSRAGPTIVREWDLAAGIRLALLLPSFGVLFGRAAAGDWISNEATVSDWRSAGELALGLAVFAALIHRMFQRSREGAKPRVLLTGAVPGVSYLVAAIAGSALCVGSR